MNDIIRWKPPIAWKVLPADGIRVAAFQIEKGSLIAEITLVILAAQTGSIEENIARWINQLGLSDNQETVQEIILNSQAISTNNMITFRVFDFTFLTVNDEETMIVAMGSIADQTLFAKVKGPNSLIVQERADFFSLLRSIALSN